MLDHADEKSVPMQRGARFPFLRSAPMQRGARFAFWESVPMQRGARFSVLAGFDAVWMLSLWGLGLSGS